MLAELKVKNYAIIEDISVTLVPGFNVLTGETGAGKSIIVGALGFALGEKVSSEVVRKGQDSCRVEVVFRLEENALKRLETAVPGLECRNGLIRVERELKREGRSSASVNGRRVSLAQLRAMGILLVDFHGQHEHQLLLNPASHVDFLDAFARLMPDRERLASRRRDLMDLSSRIGRLEQEIAHIDEKQDYIRYEISEIERLGLAEGEDEALEAEIAVLENAEKILEAGTEAMAALYDGDEAAIRNVSRAASSLDRLGAFSEPLAALAGSLEEAEVIVKEVAESLRDYLGGIDLDPARLEKLRQRQVAIERVKRKYGMGLGDVLEHLRRLRQGLDNKEDMVVELDGLREERLGIVEGVIGLARDLSSARRTAAGGFSKAVERELRTLGMQGAGFRIMFEELEEGEEVVDRAGKPWVVVEKGMESVEFFVRTNKGEDLLPLRRIASGGEISRVMLALKRVLADVDQVDAMVFDEIDAGIGGGMAGVVGEKLKEVAGSRQVICITHLAQITAPADLHLAVGKTSMGGRTVTAVRPVEGEARVEELARMLGGRKAPEAARLHAEEILKRAEAK
jgi:DNA repair protein RecN (Recombination protein N)